MIDRHRELANKVVASFKASLSESALKQITQAEFEQLVLMIREVIADELDAAAKQVEDVARRLRREADKPELGL
jgi:hypothetical protein